MTTEKNESLVNVDKAKYAKTKAASGSASLHNGDAVAMTLAGLTLAETLEIADKVMPDNDFKTRYSKLNPGMQRMNIGNRLRGHCRADSKNQTAFEKAAKPIRKAADARIKAEAKAKEDKAKAAEKAKADKAAAAEKKKAEKAKAAEKAKKAKR